MKPSRLFGAGKQLQHVSKLPANSKPALYEAFIHVPEVTAMQVQRSGRLYVWLAAEVSSGTCAEKSSLELSTRRSGFSTYALKNPTIDSVNV